MFGHIFNHKNFSSRTISNVMAVFNSEIDILQTNQFNDFIAKSI